MFSQYIFIKSRLTCVAKLCVLSIVFWVTVVNANENTPQKPNIVVSIKPIALLVKDIVGESANVSVLVKGQASGHHFQLKVSDKKRINQADIIVWVGPNLEGFLNKPLAKRRKSGKIDIAISHLLNAEPQNTHKDKGEHHHFHSQAKHNGGDPHIWLNPKVINQVSAHLSEWLIEQYPANKDLYVKNTQNAATRLLSVFNKWFTYFSTKIEQDGKRFIVFHDSMSHFVDAFVLPAPNFMMQVPDQPVSAKQLSALKKHAEQMQCVLADIPEQRQAQKYANKLGLPLITVDVLAVQYDQNVNFAGYFNRFVQDFSRCYKSVI